MPIVLEEVGKCNVCRLCLNQLGRAQCKESACYAGATGDAGSIPGLGRSPEKEMATHSSILAWKIPWIEKPGGL